MEKFLLCHSMAVYNLLQFCIMGFDFFRAVYVFCRYIRMVSVQGIIKMTNAVT